MNHTVDTHPFFLGEIQCRWLAGDYSH